MNEDFDTERLQLIEDKKFEHNTYIINHKMFKVDLCVIKWLPHISDKSWEISTNYHPLFEEKKILGCSRSKQWCITGLVWAHQSCFKNM